jgi:hypothetical protein
MLVSCTSRQKQIPNERLPHPPKQYYQHNFLHPATRFRKICSYMRKLKFTILLPVLLCFLEGLLWYSSKHWKPRSILGDSIPTNPLDLLSFGLAAPAKLLVMLFYKFLDWVWSIVWPQQFVTTPGIEVAFFLSVFLLWCCIGRWLDLRASAEYRLASPIFSIRLLLFRVLMLGVGVFFLLLSFHFETHFLAEIIGQALLQTWAVLLLAAPGLAFARQLNQRFGAATDPARLVRWTSAPITNSKLFLTVSIGLSVLLVCDFLIAGRHTKFW